MYWCLLESLLSSIAWLTPRNREIMTNEVERELRKLRHGEHLCPIHENMAESIACAAFFMKEGLALGDQCLYIADEPGVEALVQALAANGVNVAHERERDSLSFLTHRDTYLKAGVFDPREMIEFLGEKQAEALASGFSGFRVVGEISWALGPEVSHDQLIEYEVQLNRFVVNSRSVILCQYNRERFSPTVIHDMLLTHPFSILGDLVCPNPFYYPPDLALRWPAQPTSELMAKRVDWRIRQLKEARRAVQESEFALERLKESERKLAQAQRIAQLGYWEYDFDVDRVTWSDETCRMLGLPLQSSLTLAEFRQLILPEDLPIHEEAFAKVLHTQGHYDTEYRVLRPEGEVRYLHSIDEVIRDESGKAAPNVRRGPGCHGEEEGRGDVARVGEKFRLTRRTIHASHSDLSREEDDLCEPRGMRHIGISYRGTPPDVARSTRCIDTSR